MMIECLVRRDGPTQIPVGNINYMFMPYRPRGEKGPVTSIADITSEEHLKHMQRFPFTFREFVDGQALPEGLTPVVINLSGFSIDKTTDGRGYLAIKKKTVTTAATYAGSDGQWVPARDVASRNPFESEFSAYHWLKEEAAFLASEIEDDEQGEDLTCHACGKVCGSLAGLSSHVKSHNKPE